MFANPMLQPESPSRFDELRRKMVERQLAARGIRDERVLAAMGAVPRHEFVPPHVRDSAYDDCPLMIGQGQTISQPYTVAFMAEALQLRGDEIVLEVGTGSGYGAAVLSRLVRQVHTIERIEALAATAREQLRRLGFDNVQVHVGDGTLGLPEFAPFDGIVVTAGADSLPPAYTQQLADGGRIVIPIGAARSSQIMCRITRRGDHFPCEQLGSFAFVPLIGKHGWGDEW
jgi:protein-L-isoaspartate(D-aspartate) O-methyltransferase